MIRKILFRGYSEGLRRFVYGLPFGGADGIASGIEAYDEEGKFTLYNVTPATICQQISLCGFECFHREIVKTPRGIGVVEWNMMDGRYEIVLQNGETYLFNSAFNDLLEVIGNTIENEDLWEGDRHEEPCD